MSRLSRIRKIRRKVKERSDELFQRGMEELDKEDDMVPALNSHERWIENDLNFLSIPSDTNWSEFGFRNKFSEVTLSGDAVAGGTVGPSAGNSLGA